MHKYSGRRPVCLTVLCLLIATSSSCGNQSPKIEANSSVTQGAIWPDVYNKIDPKAKYLFYLHGRIIENQGIRPTDPRYGVYEYQQILDTFKDKGFIVVSEPRAKGTESTEYAHKVVDQINTLIKAGVPPQHITVVGASKGGGIAIFTSTFLKNRDVNFVIMAACGDYDDYKTSPLDFWGNILSIYDYKDDTGAGTCQKFFDKSTGINRHDEIVVKLGLGHGILYKPLKEWVDPVVAWANKT